MDHGLELISPILEILEIEVFNILYNPGNIGKWIFLLFLYPGNIGNVMCLFILIFYISSVLTTTFFGEKFYEWFGTIGNSMYTLFQIMTLESWSMGIVRPVMQEFPLAWLFFVPFILVTTFAILNLFIGIIVDAMQQISNDGSHEEKKSELDLQKKIISMELQLKEITKLLNKK